MNAGIVEETGQTARSAVEALKQSPVLLAFVLIISMLIAIVMGLTYMSLQSRNEQLHKEMETQQHAQHEREMALIHALTNTSPDDIKAGPSSR